MTGGTRLIAGTITGVYTGVVGSNGQLILNIGDVTNVNTASTSADVSIATQNRDGNLQIAQFYYGATQPSTLAAQISGALLYAQSTRDSNANAGAPSSAPDILTSGNLVWGSNATTAALASSLHTGSNTGGAVATDPTGSGTVFSYQSPCCGRALPNFFRVNGLGQTNGLLSAGGPNPDPQWPNAPGDTGVTLAPFGNFTVNPVDPQKILIGSFTGLVYATSNQGVTWTMVADGTPSGFDNSYVQALAYGAPQPSDPTGANDTFLCRHGQWSHLRDLHGWRREHPG